MWCNSVSQVTMLLYLIFDVFSTVHHSIGLFLQPTLMHNSITTCMSHYYPRHVLGLDMPILRRSNCTNTASGILALLSGCTLHQLRADWSVDGILIESISHLPISPLSTGYWLNQYPVYLSVRSQPDIDWINIPSTDQSALNWCSVQPLRRARIPDAVFVQLFLLRMGTWRPETCRG